LVREIFGEGKIRKPEVDGPRRGRARFQQKSTRDRILHPAPKPL